MTDLNKYKNLFESKVNEIKYRDIEQHAFGDRIKFKAVIKAIKSGEPIQIQHKNYIPKGQVHGPNLKTGQKVIAFYSKYNLGLDIYEIRGVTGAEQKYGEGGVKYNSVKEAMQAHQASNLRELEAIQAQYEDYGHNFYIVVKDLIDGGTGPFLYLFEGRWVTGSGAEPVSFILVEETTLDESVINEDKLLLNIRKHGGFYKTAEKLDYIMDTSDRNHISLISYGSGGYKDKILTIKKQNTNNYILKLPEPGTSSVITVQGSSPSNVLRKFVDENPGYATFVSVGSFVVEKKKNDNPVTEDTGKFQVILKGGSAGTDQNKRTGKEFSNKEEAKEYAKRMNKRLSPGEKEYYKMKYVVKSVEKIEESNGDKQVQKMLGDLYGEIPPMIIEKYKKELITALRKAYEEGYIRGLHNEVDKEAGPKSWK